jgi:hypothetical protein
MDQMIITSGTLTLHGMIPNMQWPARAIMFTRQEPLRGIAPLENGVNDAENQQIIIPAPGNIYVLVIGMSIDEY